MPNVQPQSPRSTERLRERLAQLRQSPLTHDNMVDMARAYLEEAGDVPRLIVQAFTMECDGPKEARAIEAAIDKLRAEHFKRLDKPVPPYDGPPLR